MKDLTVIVPLSKKSKIEYLENIKNQGLKVISCIGPNPSKNRNLGAKKAKTKYLAFINGHTEISKDWSKKIKDFFNRHPEVDIVGGPQLTSKNESLFGKISGYAFSSLFGTSFLRNRYVSSKENLEADETMITTANLICKKKIFEKIRFDEKLYPGEDSKFIFDAKKSGFKVAYSPEIVSYNKRRKNFFELSKQIFNYGYTRPKKESLVVTLKNPLFLIPSIFVFYLIISIFLMNKLFFIPLYLYLCLTIFFSLYESLKHKTPLCLFLPPIYLIIHISYGLGFIIGTISKFKYKKHN